MHISGEQAGFADGFGRVGIKYTRDELRSLVVRFSSLDAPTKETVITSLEQSGDRELIVRLLQVLAAEPDCRLRASGIKNLGAMLDARSIRLILKWLYDADHRVVANTVEAIEQTATPDLVSVLLKLRGHINNRVRANTLKALWSIGFTNIHDDLQEMLQSGDEKMRASAVWVIGEIGRKQLVDIKELLSRVVGDSSGMVKRNVRNAIDKLKGRKASP